MLHHHQAVVLLLDGVLPNLSLSLAGSRRGRRHRAARVLNAEVPLFGAKIGIHRDLNRYEYDSFIRVLAMLPSRDIQGYEVLEICPRGNDKMVIIIFICSW